MNVGLYSAIYGGYDLPKRIPDLGIPCVMFTDDPDLEAPGWEVRVVDMEDKAPGNTMMQHKWWKTHPGEALPDVDVSLWVDGSMEVMRDDYASLCLSYLADDDWVCVPHPSRGCIYTEADYSATLIWRYDPAKILPQAAHYRNIGHPPNWGLFATGANVRRHTPTVLKISDLWWDECVNWSHQDQLSLPVLFRLYEDQFRWNMNMPWFQDWFLHEHKPQ